ncbi:FtsK/SpoIIIE domain-containing protein [Brevibacterium renqingii]|uniref:FtsK/SpoIIIE domain-containing protein n=1 Tax=Brevibacterium renqingii TaxID=2776916 RepID=UPI001AE0603A|nr:FtsK/SpoIIIE domain-containing protein [Brevibacterium renqingii]
MRTLGLVHRVEANGEVTSARIEADSAQPVLEVFRALFGCALLPRDLLEGNRLGDGSLETITWGSWQSLNPITIIGAHTLRTTSSGAEAELASVSVLAGPDSGFALTVDPRRARLSRLPHDSSLTIIDPCLSRQPIPLEIDAAGEQETVCRGATILAPSPGAALTPGTQSSANAPGELPQFRSPPPHRREDTHIVPKTIDDPRPARPPQWWTFLIPIGIGVVLAVVTGMWWFLLFSISAPLSGYIAYLVEKKRFTRDSARCRRDRSAALAEARTRLCELEATHRRAAFTAPGLCLGFGAFLSDLTIDEQLQEGIDHVAGRVVLDSMPIRIDPMSTAVTVRGDVEQLRTMAFSWLSDRRFAWRPCPELTLLPELAGTEFAGAHATAPGLSLPRHGPTAEELIDVRLDETAHPAALSLSGPHTDSSLSMTLGSLAQALTTASTAPRGPVPGRPLIASLMPAARFVTLHRNRQTRGELRPWPSHGLGEFCDDAPDAIMERWRHPVPGPAIIGRGAHGAVGIDLFDDGPHALVAGTTGSGKSLLLQTWLLAMALAHPPRQLRFVLIDFKGGATFAPLQDLPHTDSVLDDFDSGLAFRSLVSVRAEITHRERLLADRGCADVLDLDDPPPRLVVVIDEFHALMAAHPRAADLLEHLTALGRSLGVHLILATQRPMGVVTGQMKANINIRVCLRVRDETDSFDVIGSEAGALLPADKPGAACLDTGTAVSRFRVAVPFGTDSRAEAALRPRLRPWTRGPVPSLASGLRGVSVDNIAAAAAAMPEQAPPRQVVLPPLPSPEEIYTGTEADEVLTTESLAGRSSGADSASGDEPPVVTGIIDMPKEQDQQIWVYEPDVDGSTVLTSADPAVTDSVLVRMARAAAPRRRIFALGRIASALAWAEVTCGMDTGWRMQVVLDHLASNPNGADRPPSLLVCGNWAELVDSLDHHWADRLERLLSHGTNYGLVFLLAGCRNAVSRSSRFSTQIIFPPAAGEDGLSVGLSRQRFAGRWPEFRAVLRGPRVSSAGGDGADVQLLPQDRRAAESAGSAGSGGPFDFAGCEGSAQIRSGFAPRWYGLERLPEPGVADLITETDEPPRELLFPLGTDQEHLIPIGVDAFGEIVLWNPVRDGSVLTVRGSSQSGKSEFAALMQTLANPAVSTHDDAHRETEPTDWDLLDGDLHVLTMPTRFTPGYGSQLSKAQGLGPLLVLGAHSRHDLNGLGLIRQAPLDGRPGTGWFVTEDRARAVRTFTADEAAALLRKRSATSTGSHDQAASEGGPVRVS